MTETLQKTNLLTRLFTLLLAISFLSFNAGKAFAQSGSISGKVIDQSTKGPVVGAGVTVKGTTNGTSTNASGRFTLSAPSNATLVISYLGYVKKEILASSDLSAINLAPSNSNLNEVVVIGYGTARKRDLISSVSTLQPKDFNKGLINSPDQLLQGKVAGLEITSNSGQPGSASTIVIRGNSSLRSGDAPLYVVDGAILDGRTAVPALNFADGGYGPAPDVNPLLYINPNDIAQIDVLRDASATAIYGSRGANGVIVITTKKGTGTGTHIEFGGNYASNVGFLKKYSVLDASQYRSALSQYKLNTVANNYDYGSSTDALKSITQSNLSQDYNLALTGGGDHGKFRVSFYDSKAKGFIRNTSLDKYIGTLGGQFKFFDDRLSVDFSLIAGHVDNSYGLIGNTTGANGDLITYALNWNPTQYLYDNKGQFNVLSNSIPNPRAVTEGYHDKSQTDNYLGSLIAGFKILPNLEYKFGYSINHGAGLRNTNIDGWLPLQGTQGKGAGIISKTLLNSSTYTSTLDYNVKLADFLKLDAIAGYEYYKTDYSSTSVFAEGFQTNLTQDSRSSILYTDVFQSGATQSPLFSSADPTVEIQSFFGRASFNALDKYYLVATIRDDGSSKFGSNNKYGLFPSFGAKWVLKNEGFLKDFDLLSTVALRGSWGITGSQSFPAGVSQGQFSLNPGSIGQIDIPNPNLKWEKTTQYDLGLDYGFSNGRVYGSFDYYHKNTTNLLFADVPILPSPNVIRYINLPVNLLNSGVEFTFGSTIVQNRDFQWDLNLNTSYNKNKLTNYNEAIIQTGQVNGQGVSGAFSQAIANNHPADVYYLKPFQGFDAKGQEIIGDKPVYAGDPNPHVLAGFSTSLSYKKLTLTVNGSGAFGYKIYNNTYNTITNISNLQNGKNVASYSIGTAESVSDGVAASTRYLESGNYFKLRNATLVYNFGDVTKYFKNVRVFVGGSNLFVITRFKGFDPEVNIDKSNTSGYPSRGIEYAPYPTPTTLTFGFNVGL